MFFDGIFKFQFLFSTQFHSFVTAFKLTTLYEARMSLQ